MTLAIYANSTASTISRFAPAESLPAGLLAKHEEGDLYGCFEFSPATVGVDSDQSAADIFIGEEVYRASLDGGSWAVFGNSDGISWERDDFDTLEDAVWDLVQYLAE